LYRIPQGLVFYKREEYSLENKGWLVMVLGEKIKQLRVARGWSSGELSEKSGVSRAYLWQLERGGKEHPSLQVLERLAKTLGVSVADFSDMPQIQSSAKPAPPGLVAFLQKKSRELGVTQSDVDVMKGIHFRGAQPSAPEDWELLFLFLKKWAR
jgi:transcriptional regulator with XRE-family HTH domain